MAQKRGSLGGIPSWGIPITQVWSSSSLRAGKWQSMCIDAHSKVSVAVLPNLTCSTLRSMNIPFHGS